MSYGSPSDGQIAFYAIWGTFRVETSLFHTSRCIMTITNHELKSMMEVLPYALMSSIRHGSQPQAWSMSSSALMPNIW